MRLSSKEKQRILRAKRYKGGLKPISLWVKRKESRPIAKIKQSEFIKILIKLTDGMDEDSLTGLYCLFIKIIKGQKEVAKLKRKK